MKVKKKKKLNEISKELAVRLATISFYTEEAMTGSHKLNFVELRKLFRNVELQRWLKAAKKVIAKNLNHLNDCSQRLLNICDCGLSKRIKF